MEKLDGINSLIMLVENVEERLEVIADYERQMMKAAPWVCREGVIDLAELGYPILLKVHGDSIIIEYKDPEARRDVGVLREATRLLNRIALARKYLAKATGLEEYMTEEEKAKIRTWEEKIEKLVREICRGERA